MAVKNPKDADLFKKKAQFIQHSLPGLEAGRYQIKVQQKLDKQDGSSLTGTELPPIIKNFGVKGPRYQLPQSAIHSTFPPHGGAGEFSNDLPHVVLDSKQVKLPWIRSPYTSINEEKNLSEELKYDSGTKAYDSDQASWLAVLLLSPSDIDGNNPVHLIKQGTIQDLVPNALNVGKPGGKSSPGNLPANYYSSFTHLLENKSSGVVDPGIGHLANGVCHYIDIPATTFNKIAPSLDDLLMTAHVRTVEMQHKPIASGQTVNQEESFSLVISNRLPESLSKPPAPGTPPAGQNLAVLVSLESMEFALRGYDTSSHYATEVVNKGGKVRLVVFHQWSFTSWKDTSFTFETILKSLNGRGANKDMDKVAVSKSLLRMENIPNNQGGKDDQMVIQNMLELGYLPMNHTTRVFHSTEPSKTVSWYRGPFIPFNKPIPNLNLESSDGPLVYSADALLRFDPKIGMYDVSYAVAWQLGRLLALQDKSFSVALYRWKQEIASQYSILLEEEVLHDLYDNLLALYEEVTIEEKKGLALYKSAINHL